MASAGTPPQLAEGASLAPLGIDECDSEFCMLEPGDMAAEPIQRKPPMQKILDLVDFAECNACQSLEDSTGAAARDMRSQTRIEELVAENEKLKHMLADAREGASIQTEILREKYDAALTLERARHGSPSKDRPETKSQKKRRPPGNVTATVTVAAAATVTKAAANNVTRRPLREQGRVGITLIARAIMCLQFLMGPPWANIGGKTWHTLEAGKAGRIFRRSLGDEAH